MAEGSPYQTLDSKIATLDIDKRKFKVRSPQVPAFLNSLVEEISEIAGPVAEWSPNRRQKRSNS